MADVMPDPVSDHPDLSALTGSPGQKRKREMSSPDLGRSKRTAPQASMSAVEAAAFIDSAMDGSHGAASNGVNVEDFNALQQAAAGGEHHLPDHQGPEHHAVDHHLPVHHTSEHHTQDHHVPDQHMPEHHEAEQQAVDQQPHEHHAPEDHDAQDHGNATSTAQAALGMYPTMHVPASTEEQFAAQVAAENEQHNHDHPFHPDGPQPDPLMDDSQVGHPNANGVPGQSRFPASAGSNPKPTVGSEEWHKMRKDNHKEVERRRRETINEGINELAKIVPGCEKNKGSILQRAVSFISQLKENEQQNIEKWTLEKLLTEQAITELGNSNDKLKQECERLYRELETWKRVAQNAGLEPPQPTKEDPVPTADTPTS